MHKKTIYLYGFLPNYHHPMALSGSDIRCFEIFKKISKQINLISVGTPLFFSYLKKFNIKSQSKIKIKTKLAYDNQINLTIFSLLIYLKHLPKQITRNFTPNTVHYSPADLIWNVLPCFTAKIFHKKQVWIQCIHHLYPNWYSRNGNKVINFFGYFLQKLSLLFIKHQADAIIVVNPLIVKALVAKGFNQNKIYLSKNGLNPQKKVIVKKEIDAIFVGRLSPSKGITRLIDIWSEVVKLKSNLKLYLVGDYLKGEFNAYKNQIRLLNIKKNIIFTGFVSEKEKNNLLAKSKIFVSMSKEEGFGITILEAIANRLPVYLNYLKIYPKLFGNIPKYFMHQSNFQIAKTLIMAIEKPIIDEDSYANLVKKYSWDKIANNELFIINSM